MRQINAQENHFAARLLCDETLKQIGEIAVTHFDRLGRFCFG